MLFAFLTSEIDSATSNFVKSVVHRFGLFLKSDLFGNVTFGVQILIHMLFEEKEWQSAMFTWPSFIAH